MSWWKFYNTYQKTCLICIPGVKRRNQILLDPDIICFMVSFSPIIKKALNYVLAKHLEKINPSARHIAIMIDEEKELEKTLRLLKRGWSGQTE